MPSASRGVGIADRNSLAGVVRAWSHRRDHIPAGDDFRVVVGARLVFADGTPDVLAYPADRDAYGRLTRLLTLGNRRAGKGDCRLVLPDLLADAAGLQLILCEASGRDAAPRARRPSTGRRSWRACARPRRTACGSPRRSSTARPTAGAWPSAPRCRAGPARRSSPPTRR